MFQTNPFVIHGYEGPGYFCTALKDVINSHMMGS